MTDTDAITGTAFTNFMVGDSIMFLAQSGLGDGSIFNNRFVVTEPIGRSLQRDAQHTEFDT